MASDPLQHQPMDLFMRKLWREPLAFMKQETLASVFPQATADLELVYRLLHALFQFASNSLGTNPRQQIAASRSLQKWFKLSSERKTAASSDQATSLTCSLIRFMIHGQWSLVFTLIREYLHASSGSLNSTAASSFYQLLMDHEQILPSLTNPVYKSADSRVQQPSHGHHQQQPHVQWLLLQQQLKHQFLLNNQLMQSGDVSSLDMDLQWILQLLTGDPAGLRRLLNFLSVDLKNDQDCSFSWQECLVAYTVFYLPSAPSSKNSEFPTGSTTDSILFLWKQFIQTHLLPKLDLKSASFALDACQLTLLTGDYVKSIRFCAQVDACLAAHYTNLLFYTYPCLSSSITSVTSASEEKLESDQELVFGGSSQLWSLRRWMIKEYALMLPPSAYLDAAFYLVSLLSDTEETVENNWQTTQLLHERLTTLGSKGLLGSHETDVQYTMRREIRKIEWILVQILSDWGGKEGSPHGLSEMAHWLAGTTLRDIYLSLGKAQSATGSSAAAIKSFLQATSAHENHLAPLSHSPAFYKIFPNPSTVAQEIQRENRGLRMIDGVCDGLLAKYLMNGNLEFVGVMEALTASHFEEYQNLLAADQGSGSLVDGCGRGVGKLVFLRAYADFISLIETSQYRLAAESLIRMLTTNLCQPAALSTHADVGTSNGPVWVLLLIDALTLLEIPVNGIFTSAELHELLRCLLLVTSSHRFHAKSGGYLSLWNFNSAKDSEKRIQQVKLALDAVRISCLRRLALTTLQQL